MYKTIEVRDYTALEATFLPYLAGIKVSGGRFRYRSRIISAAEARIPGQMAVLLAGKSQGIEEVSKFLSHPVV